MSNSTYFRNAEIKVYPGVNTKRGAKSYQEKADAIQVHVDKLKEILFVSQKLV